jgi:hypothetical protein
MIKSFSFRLLGLTLFVLTVGIVTSCDKDDDEVSSDKIQLLSFGPTGAKHGDTLRFIGLNLNKVTAIQFTGTNATVNQADFKQQTSELIRLIVPQTAEQGFVTLKTPEGDIVTKTKFNLDVLTTVTSITPQARPGTNVTINGTFLNWVDRVTFNLDKTVDVFVSKTQTQLVVKVPDDAQTGPLVLHYAGTDSNYVQTTDTLKVTLPVGTGMTPNPIKHQTNLTITGTDLDLTKQVLFTGVTAPVTTFVSQSATQLVVRVPASTTKGKVTLVAASGVQTISTTDLDVVLPAITGMTPNPVAPASNVTVTGTNLDVVSSISFVGVAAAVTSFVSQSATEIIVTVPTGALTGKVTFFVLNSTLNVKSSNDLAIVGSSVPPIIIYDDAITSAWTAPGGWIGGGWGGTKDLNNTSPVKSGTKSCRISYVGDWGVPLQLGGSNISLAGYTSLKVSIYGGAGSNGKNVNIGFNEADGKTVTVVEGQWTDFTIPLNQISATSTLTHLYIKKYTAGTDFTIYIDDLGLY